MPNENAGTVQACTVIFSPVFGLRAAREKRREGVRRGEKEERGEERRGEAQRGGQKALHREALWGDETRAAGCKAGR